MTVYMIAGLVKRRAEIAGQVQFAQKALSLLLADLETLDAALRLLAPSVDASAIRPRLYLPKDGWAKRGEMTRPILDILRRAEKPLTTREIAMRLVVMRGLPVDDAKLIDTMVVRVKSALRDQRARGVVLADVSNVEGPLCWRVPGP